MKILVALAVFFLVSTQLFAEEIGTSDDLNYWSDWSDSDQIKALRLLAQGSAPRGNSEELPEPFEHLLQRIARRPKPQQFFGLMGKRDAGETGSHPSLSLSEQPAQCPRSLLLRAPCLFCSLSRNFHPKMDIPLGSDSGPHPTNKRTCWLREGELFCASPTQLE
ncbi:unnamed protein product [Gulo gulo]|uniref:Protachykinin-1 n=1 Tax=Gulo gulo TaxID=48420 RepID=A0A9X9LR07_GULGU|nr:unnamed protein product [Gulo gulo]